MQVRRSSQLDSVLLRGEISHVATHDLHVFSTLLLSSASNADNLAAGVALGVRGTNFSLASNLMVAAITALGTLATVAAGRTLAAFLDGELANLIGGLLVIAAGLWLVAKELWTSRRRARTRTRNKQRRPRREGVFGTLMHSLDNPCTDVKDPSKAVSLKESALLGVALTFNNLVNGFSAGMIGVNYVLMTGMVFVFSIIAVWLGVRAGCSIGYRWLGRSAGPASGLLLIAVGVYEVVS